MVMERIGAPTSPSGVAKALDAPKDNLVLIVVAVCSVIAVLSVRLVVGGTNYVVSELPGVATALFVLGLLAAAAFAWVRYPDEAPFLRITLAGCSVLIGVNSLWLGFDFPIVDQEVYDGVAPIIAVAPYIVVIAAALALFRPSFALVVALVFIIQKRLVLAMAGGLPATSHYVVLIDTMVLIGVALIGFELARVLARRFGGDAINANLSEPQTQQFFYLLTMCIAIGVHFGNYFLSGIGKVILDGGVLSWILDNKTQYLMLAGYNVGAAPLSFSPALFGFGYNALSSGYILLNIVVLFAQCFCMLAFLRKKLMMAWVVFFDVMHIVIFLLTGALFLHWIVLNSLLLLSVARMPRNLAPSPALAAGVVATMIGHIFFHTIMLAWYDNRQIRDAGYVAIYADGSEAEVPPSFFRESSYSFYNRWFRIHPKAGDQPPEAYAALDSLEWQAQTVAWGQVLEVASMERGEACGVPNDGAPVKLDFDVAAAEKFIRARHQWAMDRIAKGESLNYHFFPHDHVSMPWLFEKFETSDVRDIVAYYYKVETVCLSWEDGALKREVATRTATKPYAVKGGGDAAR